MDILISIPDEEAPRFVQAILKRGGYNPVDIPEHQAITEGDFAKRTLGALLADWLADWEARDETEQVLNELAKKKAGKVKVIAT